MLLISFTVDSRNDFDRDFHLHRLDNNGYWPNKPGRTPATNLETCFMTINRNTITLRKGLRQEWTRG